MKQYAERFKAMSFQMIPRREDMITGEEDLVPLHIMKHFPIYMGVTDDAIENDMFADEEWMISETSGMIQLGSLVPLEVLYAKSHNSGIGKVWKRHNKYFADFIHKHRGSKGVLEVGGGNGILNAVYQKKFGDVEWTIIEPSDVCALDGCKARYLRLFWDEKTGGNLENISYDTLIHAHCMEHQFDVNEFMKINSDTIAIGDKMIFSLPNMKILLQRNYPYALNFEHTYLITEDYVDMILKKFGFSIDEKFYFEDHSIFYATTKIATNSKLFQYDKIRMKILYENSKELFLQYIGYYSKKVETLNNIINTYEDGEIFIFGAHINTQLLINFGLTVNKIKSVLDNDEKKQGHRLYGTGLRVDSPCILGSENKPLVILVMGAYNDEIEDDIKKNINKNTKFVS